MGYCRILVRCSYAHSDGRTYVVHERILVSHRTGEGKLSRNGTLCNAPLPQATRRMHVDLRGKHVQAEEAAAWVKAEEAVVVGVVSLDTTDIVLRAAHQLRQPRAGAVAVPRSATTLVGFL